MKRFDDYYNACMSDLLGEDNTSNVPNPEDFNAETSVDVADKLAEELKEHFGEDVKEVQIPSTLSNQIKAFLWTNDALKISIQISVLKSRIDNDYKITIQDLSKEDSKVIDIPDDQVETQIMDVIEKLEAIKDAAKGPESTSDENDSTLPQFNTQDNNPANPANPQNPEQPAQSGGSGTPNEFSQGLNA
jgi:hypothetical protein